MRAGRAWARWARTNYAGAIRDFERAIELDGSLAAFGSFIADCHYRNGDEVAAFGYWVRTFEYIGLQALIPVLEAGFEDGGYVGAVRALKQSLEQAPGEWPQAYSGLLLQIDTVESADRVLDVVEAATKSYGIPILWQPQFHKYRDDPRFQALLGYEHPKRRPDLAPP